jgi:hypothetical protein
MELAKRTLIFCGAILALVIAAPAFAQYTGQGYYLGLREAGCGAYDNNHRWHDPTWWHRHYVECFYATRQETAVMDGVWLTPDSDYDNTGKWHDAYRWHQNNPDFYYADHPHWISWGPNGRDQAAAYDAQNDWHYGRWWYNGNPNLVSTSHPNSISAHRNWADHSGPLDHRSLTRIPNEGNQQHASTQQNPARKAAVICTFLLALRSGLSP